MSKPSEVLAEWIRAYLKGIVRRLDSPGARVYLRPSAVVSRGGMNQHVHQSITSRRTRFWTQARRTCNRSVGGPSGGSATAFVAHPLANKIRAGGDTEVAIFAVDKI